MDDYLKQFLIPQKESIMKNDFDTVFFKARVSSIDMSALLEFLQFKAGIDVIKYITILPQLYGKTIIPDLKVFEIPSHITSIDSGAFFGCSNLQDLIIPKSVDNIGAYMRSLLSIQLNEHTSCIIHYDGTIADWNKITKDPQWDYDSNISSIQCSDGEIKGTF